MATRVYNLVSGQLSASSDNAAEVDVVRDGKVVAISLTASDNASTDSEWHSAVTVQTGATSAVTNANIGVLLALRGGYELTTSGSAAIGSSNSVSGIAIPIQAGQKFYLVFSEISGAASVRLSAQVYVEER